MAGAAVTFLLEKVTVVLKYYGDLIGGSENELQSLKRELELLKAGAQKLKRVKVFTGMELQMREVVYEVEDNLDRCLVNAAAAATAENEEQRRLAPVNFVLAKEIKSLIHDKLKPIIEKAAKVELDHMRIGDRSGDEEPLTFVMRDKTFRRDSYVGLEDVEEDIVGFLMEEREKLDVIPITGMPGLGKTTLTRKIYESQKIQYEFHNRIWVNVSQQFNKRELFLHILKVFTSKDVSSLSDQELVKEVRAYLTNEVFLIVFDDVWNVDDWKTIKKVLPMSNGMGKVIITSHFLEIGTSSSIREPYVLRFLTKEESWKLLQVELFGDVGWCPDELNAVGQQIAHNCDGLPRTIVVVGGILVAQYTRQRPLGMIKKEWINLSKNLIYFIKTDRINHISNIVRLCYDILPDELRECYIYMGAFPEDHEITSWTLTRLWIAEGFIQQKEGQSLEETAEEYLNELINRNLLVVRRINPMGENKTCCVRDAIHTFCYTKAAEQNLFQEIRTSNQGVYLPPIPATEKYHRICSFRSDDPSKFLSGKPSYPSVRSFLCFYEEPVDLETQYITAIPDAFGLLRVLDSKSIKFNQFPTRLVKLIHLRYVTLYVDDLKILPEPMSQLRNLQTLVVDTNSRTLTMKANIWRMIWLRHLKTKAAIVLDQKWEGDAGENLQTLSTLSPESCTESVSNRARNIKELAIRGDLAVVFDSNNKFLEKLRLLEKLKLVNNDKLGIRIPRTNCFPKNLKRLTLRRTSLQWSDMSTLAKIKTLEVLKLKDNAFTGITWTVIDGFPSLRFLLIADADIVSWEASGDHFPSLTCLSIKNCRTLETIPRGLAKNLLKLDIDFLGASATNSAWVIQKQKEMDQRNEEENVGWRVQFQLSVGVGCKLDQALF